jgi:hypothetical protein
MKHHDYQKHNKVNATVNYNLADATVYPLQTKIKTFPAYPIILYIQNPPDFKFPDIPHKTLLQRFLIVCSDRREEIHQGRGRIIPCSKLNGLLQDGLQHVKF